MDTRKEYRDQERASQDAYPWGLTEVACTNCNHWMSAHETSGYAAMKGQCGWCSCRKPEAKTGRVRPSIITEDQRRELRAAAAEFYDEDDAR